MPFVPEGEQEKEQQHSIPTEKIAEFDTICKEIRQYMSTWNADPKKLDVIQEERDIYNEVF